MRHRSEFLGYVRFKVKFHLAHVGALREPEPASHPEDVRIHGYDRFSPGDRRDHVGGLPSDSGQAHELPYVPGNLSAEIGYQLPGHAREVRGLAVGIGHGPDVREYLLRRRRRERAGVRIGFEQRRGDHVHAPVGALCREHHCHQQLVGRVEMQLGFRHRHIGAEIFQDAFVSLLECHLISVQASSLVSKMRPG